MVLTPTAIHSNSYSDNVHTNPQLYLYSLTGVCAEAGRGKCVGRMTDNFYHFPLGPLSASLP